MNSASSCFSASAVAFGAADRAGRAMGRTTGATRKTTARNGRNDFMLPPGIARLFYSDGGRRLARRESKAQPESSLSVRRRRREMRVHPRHHHESQETETRSRLCYTSGHRHEKPAPVSARFACAWDRRIRSGFRTDFEPARSSYAAGKAPSQCAPVDVWRTECRGLFLRRWQETHL